MIISSCSSIAFMYSMKEKSDQSPYQHAYLESSFFLYFFVILCLHSSATMMYYHYYHYYSIYCIVVGRCLFYYFIISFSSLFFLFFASSTPRAATLSWDSQATHRRLAAATHDSAKIKGTRAHPTRIYTESDTPAPNNIACWS